MFVPSITRFNVWPFCSDYNHKRSLWHRLPHHITRGHLRSVSVQINYLRLLSGRLVASALLRWWRLHLRGIMIMKDPSAANKHDCNLRRFMKHMRSLSSHRNNVNTITITAVVGSTKYVLQDPYIYCNKICPFPGTTGQVEQKPALVYGNVVLDWLWLWSLINDCQPPRFSINTSMFANRIFPAKARVFCSNQFGANQQPMSAPEESCMKLLGSDAGLGSVFLEATFNPKSNILGLISGNVC